MRRRTHRAAQRGLVPDRQPGPVRRGDPGPGRRRSPGGSPSGLDAARRSSPTVVWKPVLTDSDAIRRACSTANADAGCVGVITWMHTFSPAKMWIAGLDALRKPLLHLHTQANVAAAVGDDRHGLHEPQPGRARRPGVRLHRRPGSASPARRSPGTSATRRSPPGSAPGPGPRPARPRLRSLRLARFGDNMRDVAVTEGDKVEAELRFGVSVNTYGVNDLVAVVDAGRATPPSTSWSPSTSTSTTSRRACARRRRGTTRCATPPGSRPGCGSSSTTAASARSPRTSRTSAGCGSCPGSPCSG